VFQLLLSKCHIFVTLSGSVSGRTIPFLLTRLSLRNVDVINWSTMVFAFFWHYTVCSLFWLVACHMPGTNFIYHKTFCCCCHNILPTLFFSLETMWEEWGSRIRSRLQLLCQTDYLTTIHSTQRLQMGTDVDMPRLVVNFFRWQVNRPTVSFTTPPEPKTFCFI